MTHQSHHMIYTLFYMNIYINKYEIYIYIFKNIDGKYILSIQLMFPFSIFIFDVTMFYHVDHSVHIKISYFYVSCQCEADMSSKERTRQYRERLNNDPARREEILRERRKK